MPRKALNDRLQVNKFWLMDVAPIESLALPVFTPIFGFKSITAPELEIETHEVKEGNWHYTKKYVKSASIGTITLERGATFADSDFWRWVQVAVTGDTENYNSSSYGAATALAKGDVLGLGTAASVGLGAAAGLFGFPRIGGPSPRRDLLLVQYFNNMDSISPELGPLQLELLGVIGGGSLLSFGPTANVDRIFSRVPARAWKLVGCIPIRYKSGGDFDATSSEVSIMELDIDVDYFDEISLSDL